MVGSNLDQGVTVMVDFERNGEAHYSTHTFSDKSLLEDDSSREAVVRLMKHCYEQINADILRIFSVERQEVDLT